MREVMRIKRTPLAERAFPEYSDSEELCNMLTHMAGIILGIAVLILCVAKAAVERYMPGLVTGTVFGVSMIMLYTVSTVYHGWKKDRWKKILQVIDHCMIYMLIVGTFVPVCLTGLLEQKPVLAWSIFAGICAIATVGIVFSAIDFHKYRVLSMVGYLSPWLVVFAIRDIVAIYGMNFMYLIAAGGVAYTIGAVLYLRKREFMHTAFHIFILIGSILHFAAVWIYCI